MNPPPDVNADVDVDVVASVNDNGCSRMATTFTSVSQSFVDASTRSAAGSPRRPCGTELLGLSDMDRLAVGPGRCGRT
ncbi:hypothetical protein ACFQ1S_17085, partial [Kibdelosporangium lantanae]